MRPHQHVSQKLTPVLLKAYTLKPCSGAQACAHLSRLTADLEAAAHPALDALTKKVCTASLERVRRIKTRLVRLKTRAETVRL